MACVNPGRLMRAMAGKRTCLDLQGFVLFLVGLSSRVRGGQFLRPAPPSVESFVLRDRTSCLSFIWPQLQSRAAKLNFFAYPLGSTFA